jgi:spermidine/putrescine transport system ATP-binding protein
MTIIKNQYINKNKNILELRNISKEYDGKVILKGISFNVHENEFLTILGLSGTGKTTILRLINGLERPNGGQIFFRKENLLKIPIDEREINTIFQNLALFNHLNVYENIAYGLKAKKVPNIEINKKIESILMLVKLQGYQSRMIHELSGGEKQRVAIARALVNEPKILLLDEPFSSLDLELKRNMQKELKRIQTEINITFIFITHDQEEGLKLADRVILLHEGKIQQVGKPKDIYDEPENKWVAKFIGYSNIIEDAVFLKDCQIKFDDKKFMCVDRGFGINEKNIDVVIRSEDIDIVKEKLGFFTGTIKNIIFKGAYWEIIILTKYRQFLIHTTNNYKIDQVVGIKWKKENIHVMWKEVDN